MAEKKKAIKKPSADSSAEENKRGRGRPPGSKNFKKETGVKTIRRKNITAPKLQKKCACCGRELVLNNFYQSNSPIHKDKYSPYCKDCVWNECQSNGRVDRVKLKAMCVTLNRPYAESALTSAYLEYEKKYSGEAKEEMEDESAIIKLYFKNVNSLTQYNQYDFATWEQKELMTKVGSNGGKQDIPSLKRALKQGERVELDDPIYDSDAYIDRFKVTKEVLRRFGEGY